MLYFQGFYLPLSFLSGIKISLATFVMSDIGCSVTLLAHLSGFQQSSPRPLAVSPTGRARFRFESSISYQQKNHQLRGGFFVGAPVGIRTQGLPLRRRTLYPAELQVLVPSNFSTASA